MHLRPARGAIDGDDPRRRQELRGRGQRQPAARLPVAWARHPVLLLAPRTRLGRRMPPVCGEDVPRRRRSPGSHRHVVHDAFGRQHLDLDRRRGSACISQERHRVPDGQPPARLPGVRGRRELSPAGHDGDDRSQRPALSLQQAHAPQPGPRTVPQPRDEPLHRLLPLRALLQRLRRRQGLHRLQRTRQRLLRARHRRGVRERVLRQPGGSLPDRRVHRPYPLRALQPQVGHAVRAKCVPAVCGRLQHQPG